MTAPNQKRRQVSWHLESDTKFPVWKNIGQGSRAMSHMNYRVGRAAAESDAAQHDFDLGSICKSIGSFGDDPPEGVFQRGYLERLLQLADDALKTYPANLRKRRTTP